MMNAGPSGESWLASDSSRSIAAAPSVTHQTEFREAVCGAPDERRILAPSAFAVNAELLCTVSDPAGLLPRALDKQARRRLAAERVTHWQPQHGCVAVRATYPPAGARSRIPWRWRNQRRISSRLPCGVRCPAL